MAGFCKLTDFCIAVGKKYPRLNQCSKLKYTKMYYKYTDQMVAVCWLISQTTYIFPGKSKVVSSPFQYPVGLKSHQKQPQKEYFSLGEHAPLPPWILGHALHDTPSQLCQKHFFLLPTAWDDSYFTFALSLWIPTATWLSAATKLQSKCFQIHIAHFWNTTSTFLELESIHSLCTSSLVSPGYLPCKCQICSTCGVAHCLH